MADFMENLADDPTFLANLINHLPGYAYRVQNDLAYTPLYISEQVVSVTGYTQDEYLLHHTISCGQEIHPDDAQWVWEAVQAALANRENYHLDYRIITKQGQERWVNENGRGIFDEQGTLLYLEGFVMDITERKRLEEELIIKEIALTTSINGIAMADLSPHIIFVNDSFAAMWGYSREELMHMTPADLVAHPHEIELLIEQLLLTGAWIGELLCKRKNGSLFVCELTATVARNKAGKPICLFGSFADVTLRKEAEHKILEQNELLKHIAFVESHVLRRPIASILGLYNLVQMAREHNDLQQVYEYLELLHTCVKEADVVIHQIVNKINEAQAQDEAV